MFLSLSCEEKEKTQDQIDSTSPSIATMRYTRTQAEESEKQTKLLKDYLELQKEILIKQEETQKLLIQLLKDKQNG